MKQMLIFFAAATFITACKNKDNNSLAIDRNSIPADTSLRQRSNMFSDTGYTIRKNSDGTTTTITVTTTTTGIPHEQVDTSNRGNLKSQRHNKNALSAKNVPPRKTGTLVTPVKRDKGWSSAAKGTAIGAGSGAIVGAVVSNNKVKGAVIGGVAGAAGGYAIGRDMDKKSGRVERKKKQ